MEFDGKKSRRTGRRLADVSVFLGEGVAGLVSGETLHEGGQQRQSAEEGDELEQIQCHSNSPYEVCAAGAATT